MKFLKYFWSDGINKAYLAFLGVYLFLFHILGYFVGGIDMSERSLWVPDTFCGIVLIVFSLSSYIDHKKNIKVEDVPDLNMH